jgi:5-methylcytosine-specific restriction endonuclease McrA
MARRYRKKYYNTYDEDEAVGFAILMIIYWIIGFITKYWIIILLVLGISIILFILIKNRNNLRNGYQNYYLRKLKKKSKLFSNIQLVNAKYDLEELTDFIDYYSVRFKSNLENCNIDDYLMMTIENRYDDLLQYKKKYDYLSKKYQEYLEEYDALKKYIDASEAKQIKFSVKKYNEYQSILFEENKKTRFYQFKVVIYINYRSSKGRVKKSIHKIYYPEEFSKIRKQYVELKNKNQLYEISSRIERAKMSDSIRYDVLKRDNYKCSICGRGKKDGVTLEVDHIIPVSKGGKTEMNNLQTLCDRCNRGKSNKI